MSEILSPTPCPTSLNNILNSGVFVNIQQWISEIITVKVSEVKRCCCFHVGQIPGFVLVFVYSSYGCPLPHSSRQVGAHWHLPPPLYGHLKHCRAPAWWSSRMPHWDIRGVAEESRPSPHLVCHCWGCGVSGGGAAWERTQKEVLSIKWNWQFEWMTVHLLLQLSLPL